MEKIREGESQKGEDAGARKGRNVAKRCVFSNVLWLRRVEKYRPAKAACAEPAGQMRDEKVHTVVAHRTCGSRKYQSTLGSERFWTLRLRKSARRCGAKHIWK